MTTATLPRSKIHSALGSVFTSRTDIAEIADEKVEFPNIDRDKPGHTAKSISFPYVRRVYRSVSHFIRENADTKLGESLNASRDNRVMNRVQDQQNEASSFNGYNDASRMLEKLTNPDAETARKFSQAVIRISSKDQDSSFRRKIRRNLDDGSEIDVWKALTGAPECWEKTRRETFPGRTVKIGMSMSISAGTKSDVMFYRGVAAAALCNILVRRGIGTSVTTTGPGGNCYDKKDYADPGPNHYGYLDLVPVVSAGTLPDPQSIYLALCDIGFFRQSGFVSIMANVPKGYDICYGLGHPVDLKSFPESLEFDLIVDGDISNHDKALAFVMDKLGELDL